MGTVPARALWAHIIVIRRASTYVWPFVVLAALLAAFAPFPGGDGPEPTTREFRIEASQFSYAPSELHVNRGDRVTLELTSADAVHGLYVDGYGLSVQADPGQTATLSFIADRPGSFRFRCNVTCGALHPFMIGRLTVGSNTLFVRGAGLALVGALGALLLIPHRSEKGKPT